MIEGLDRVFTERGLVLIIRENSDIRLEALRAESLEIVASEYAWQQSVKSARRQAGIRAAKTATAKKKVAAGFVPREYSILQRSGWSGSSRTSYYMFTAL